MNPEDQPVAVIAISPSASRGGPRPAGIGAVLVLTHFECDPIK